MFILLAIWSRRFIARHDNKSGHRLARHITPSNQEPAQFYQSIKYSTQEFVGPFTHEVTSCYQCLVVADFISIGTRGASIILEDGRVCIIVYEWYNHWKATVFTTEIYSKVRFLGPFHSTLLDRSEIGLLRVFAKIAWTRIISCELRRVQLHYYSAHSPLGLFSDRLHQALGSWYLLSLDYLSLQRLRYYFPNCVYPNPPANLPCGRKPEKTHDFRQSVDRLFSHESVARIKPTNSEVKGACSDD
jgi:hypothetical protein